MANELKYPPNVTCSKLEPSAFIGEELKMPAAGILHVGGEYDAFVIREEKRRKIRISVVGQLLLVFAVSVAHEDLHFPRFDKLFRKEVPILSYFCAVGGMIAPVNDLLAIPGEKCASVITEFVRDPSYSRTIEVHGVQFQIAVAGRGKHNFVALRRNCRFGIISGARGQNFEVAAIRVR